MTRVLLDTSAAVPLLLADHGDHRAALACVHGVEPVLAAHSLAETYAVLTRLPGSARLAAEDAVLLLDDNFSDVLHLVDDSQRNLHRTLAAAGVTGGAVYDALIALTAMQHEVPLLSRDERARRTYEALGVTLA